jgi:hypothetical protein
MVGGRERGGTNKIAKAINSSNDISFSDGLFDTRHVHVIGGV